MVIIRVCRSHRNSYPSHGTAELTMGWSPIQFLLQVEKLLLPVRYDKGARGERKSGEE